MHFLVYPGDRCNLRCKYCDTEEERKKLILDRQYDIEKLKKFLRNARNPSLTFYGGEPTLNPEFIMELMDSINFTYVSMVTNTFFLHNVPISYLKRMQMISMSIDGTKEVTDAYRGIGVYDMVMKRKQELFDRGYRNLLTGRMTVSLGTDIFENVMHLIDKFNIIHWQLNVFHKESFEQAREFKEWFDSSYNPGIKRLIRYWMERMRKGEVLRLVPFIGIMHTLLTGKSVKNIRCGAGHEFWVITTSGKIFSCPIFRDDDKYKVSDIDRPSSEIKPAFTLKSPCVECSEFSVCGGRCLYANEHARDKEIFGVVCDSVKFLIDELRDVEPEVRQMIYSGKIKLSDFDYYFEHEVIP